MLEEMRKVDVEDLGDGIYKLISPVRVDRQAWVMNETNSDLMMLGTNYGDDNKYCDVLYLTKSNYNALFELCLKKISDLGNPVYKTCQCLPG